MRREITSRAFNQNVSAAKRAAVEGPVVVTDRGRPSHVLLSYEEYCRMAETHESALYMFADGSPEADFDFEPERLKWEPRPVDFD